jgi:hypothetical protein
MTWWRRGETRLKVAEVSLVNDVGDAGDKVFTLPEDKDEALRLAVLATEVLTMLVSMASGATPTTAIKVLTLMRVVLDHLQQCFVGEVTVEDTRKALKKLLRSLDANDQTADRALERKLKN